VNVGVTIVTAEHRDVLTIPREALRQDDSKPYVFQIVNNELKRQEVQTSISNLTQVEISSGLSENAEVALTSTNSKPLYKGVTVKVVR
jgi:HlyD family secretion protein